MSIGRTLLLVTCLVFGLWPAGGPSARAAAADEARTQARDTWMNGYLKIEKAVKAEEGGNPERAAEIHGPQQAADIRKSISYLRRIISRVARKACCTCCAE